jgi:2,4-dienoyl-CoA reductase-like NADH-dependent reductase (Old Yellow Enzyme family)/thioredoxin reductase
MVKLVKLFEPVKIGKMELKNRIVMPPMTTSFASEMGTVTQRLVDYYAERAKGGVGLIIVEATSVDSPLGRLFPTSLSVDRDLYIPGLNDLAESVQAYGAKIALQLVHAGRQTTLAATEGQQPVSSSDAPSSVPGMRARALSGQEVKGMVEKFAEGARRAKVAGFDAVEIHGAHGYLIAQFLSPYINRRTDEYGGDLEGRTRFALEVAQRTRDKVGDDFPLIFRISGDEFIRGGLTLEDTKAISKMMQRYVDAVHVSAGLRETAYRATQPMALPRGCLVPLAEGIKRAVEVPVIAVGRINDPILAEEILSQGKADLIAMGRALIADPEMPRKAMEGRLEDIRRCIACVRGCSERLMQGLRISCDVNAAVGRERDCVIAPAVRRKRVTVVGGGPAGMEAARVAAVRGHAVVLYEKERKLGGQLNLSIKPPHKEEIQGLIDYLTGQLRALKVRVVLGKEVDGSSVLAGKPDAVVLATGSVPVEPNVSGLNLAHTVNAWDVLGGKAVIKGRRVVVVGGGMVGCEIAELVAGKGKRVSVVEMLKDIAVDVPSRARLLLLERLAELRVEVQTNLKVVEVTREGVVAEDRDWNRHVIPADTVVFALGSRANNKLVGSLRGRVPELYLVGDCARPRKIFEAIHEGSHVARQI